MTQRIEIGWGELPRWVNVPGDVSLICPRDLNPPLPWDKLLSDALDSPVGSTSLRARLETVSSVSIIVPDNTRKGVEELILPSILGMVNGQHISVGVATGKHPVYTSQRGHWVHDASSPDLRYVGRTRYGTDVRFPAQVVDADLRILIGEIRPHYFAGYSGGSKTLFPGVAGADGIWFNHEMKALPGARLGTISDNPCRADMEEAAAMAGPSFIVNLIRGADGQPVCVVAGDPIAAHREGVRLAQRVFEVPVGELADVVVVSDRSPVTMNLYQACKLLPPAGCMLNEGGTVIIAAQCAAGLGPVDVINNKIYRLGMIHSLPKDHRVILVSDQPKELVERSFAEYAPTVETALESLGGSRVAVIPFAGEVLPVLGG